jgi:hypothetical protein
MHLKAGKESVRIWGIGEANTRQQPTHRTQMDNSPPSNGYRLGTVCAVISSVLADGHQREVPADGSSGLQCIAHGQL